MNIGFQNGNVRLIWELWNVVLSKNSFDGKQPLIKNPKIVHHAAQTRIWDHLDVDLSSLFVRQQINGLYIIFGDLSVFTGTCQMRPVNHSF